MKKVNKYIIGVMVGILFCVAVYFTAKLLVNNSYSSEDIIKENVQAVQEESTKSSEAFTGSEESSESTSDVEIEVDKIENINGIIDGVVYEEAYLGTMQYDSSKYSMGYDRCLGIPESVYDTRDITARTELFLAGDYESYEGIIENIKSNYTEYFDGLSYDWCWENFDDSEDHNEYMSGDYISTPISDILNADLLSFDVVSQYYNDSEALAIAFFDDYYVIYEVILANNERLLIVVDYTHTAFHPETSYVTFNGILNNGLRVYMENANYKNIDGWNVLFVKNDPGRYFDKHGNSYSGQDLIDMSGRVIDW